MNFAEDVKTLRGQGIKDDDILSFMEETSPQHSKDIKALKQHGAKSSEILDFMSSDGPKAQEESSGVVGALQTGVKALGYGAAQTAGGIKETLRQTAGEGAATDLTGTVEGALLPKDYSPSKFRVTDPSTWSAGELGKALVEGAPGTAQDLAAGGAGATIGSFLGPLGAAAGGAIGYGGSYALRNFGRNSKERAVARTGDENAEPTTNDQLVAGGQTALGAAVSRFGINPAVSSLAKGAGGAAVKEVAKDVGKAAATNAAAGAAEQAVNEAGRTVGTDASFDGRSIVDAAGMGGITGAAIRGLRAPADINNAVKFRDVDAGDGGALANRFNKLGLDLNNPKEAAQALERARGEIKIETDNAIRPMMQTLTELVGDPRATDAFRKEIGLLRNDLENGVVVPRERVSSILDPLEGALGKTQETTSLRSLMNERNSLNQVAKKGYEVRNPTSVNPAGEHTFSGGITSNPTVNTLINPIRGLNRYINGVGLGSSAAGVAGLSLPAQAAALAGPLAKVAMGQAALYGAARGADAFLGNRNTLRQFTDRFADANLPSRTEGDSVRDLVSRQRQQKKLDAELAKYNSDPGEQPSGPSKSEQKQADRAWKQKEQQDAAARKAADERAAAFDKAMPDPAALAAQKAAQEEAMWAQNDRASALPPNPEADMARAGAFDNKATGVAKSELLKGVRANLAFGKKAKAAQDAQAKEQAAAEKQAATQESRQAREGERIAAQQSDVFDGMTKKDVSAIRRNVQGINKLDRMRQAAAGEEAPSSPITKDMKDVVGTIKNREAMRAKAQAGDEKAAQADQKAREKATAGAIQGFRESAAIRKDAEKQKAREQSQAAKAEERAKSDQEKAQAADKKSREAATKAAIDNIRSSAKLRAKAEQQSQQNEAKQAKAVERDQKAAEQSARDKAKADDQREAQAMAKGKKLVRGLELREKLKGESSKVVTPEIKDAYQAIKDRERIKKNSEPKPEKAPSEPKPQKEPKPKAEAPKAAPQADEADGPMLRVTVGNGRYVMERPAQGVEFPDAYKKVMRKRGNIRVRFIDDLMAATPPNGHDTIHALRDRLLSSQHKNWDSAQAEIQDAINQYTLGRETSRNEEIVKRGLAVFDKHKENLRSTYGSDKTYETKEK